MGDIHGQTERAEALLRNAQIIDEGGGWAAGDSTLWFIGDFFDRGPDGAAAVHLARRLQDEAPAQGGAVQAILGNHELMVLGVLKFGEERPELVNLWTANGGRFSDLDALGDEDRDWIGGLPAAGVAGETLLIHCDSSFYADRGDSLDELNDSVREVVSDGSFEQFYELLETFFSRFEFSEDERLEMVLDAFSARRVIHGHTPIPIVLDSDPDSVTEPLVYADGRCTNVDGGMYLGGPGFLYRHDV